MSALRITLVLAATLAVPPPGHAQAIRGRLLDARTDRPVSAGSVVLLGVDGTRISVGESDADGTFQVNAPGQGVYDLYAERLGYLAGVATLELTGDQDVMLEFRLEPSALAIDSLEVTAAAPPTALDRAGFTSRRQSGIGHFLTREQLLERGRQRDITDALRTLTGVYTEQSQFGPDRLLLRKVGTPMDPRPFCEPYLFMDGLPVQPPWEDLVDLDDVAAVEVYPEAGKVPASFASRGQRCGVVVVWSRLHYDPGG